MIELHVIAMTVHKTRALLLINIFLTLDNYMIISPNNAVNFMEVMIITQIELKIHKFNISK